MTAAADAVADKPGEFQLRVEMAEAVGDRGDRPRHARRVDRQENWRRQPFGDFRARTIIGCWCGAIEEAHHALDYGDIGVARDTREGCEDGLAAHHPAV